MFRVNAPSQDAISTSIVARIGVVPGNVVAVVLNSDLQIPKHQKDRFLHHIVSADADVLKTANDGDFEYYYDVKQLRSISTFSYTMTVSKKKVTRSVQIYSVPNGSVENYAKQVSPEGLLNDEVELRRRFFINLADVQMCNTDKCYNAYKCACVNLLAFVVDKKDEFVSNYFSYVPILFAYSLIQPYKCEKYRVDIATLKKVYEFCVAGKYTHPNTDSIYRKYADGLPSYEDAQAKETSNLSLDDFKHKFVKYLLYVNNRNLESVAYIISLTDSPTLLQKYHTIFIGNHTKDTDPRDIAKVEDFKYSACTYEPFKLDPEYEQDGDSILDEKFLLLTGLVNKDVIVGGASVLQSDVLATILSQ